MKKKTRRAPGLPQQISGKRTLEDIRQIVRHARWMTTTGMRGAAGYMTRRLNEVSTLGDVRVIELPADGRTFHGGWVMPRGWEVNSATLRIVSSSHAGTMLANYAENPWNLMMWSPPTKGTVSAPVVLADPQNDNANIKGKFVLLETLGQIGTEALAWAVQRGAVGLITDHVIERKGSKEGPALAKAVQYWNYTNPQWQRQPRLPAFGLTPEMGQRLRSAIAAGEVLLEARVDSCFPETTFPLVTALLPGRLKQELVLTAHMDEPGASDNASGTALAMEVVRGLAAYVQERGRKLTYGVRLLSSVEVRGLQGYLNTTGYGKEVLCGMNLDMLGYDHTSGRTSLQVIGCRPATPSGLEYLLGELAAKEAKKKPRFTWRGHQSVEVNDCHFAGRPFGVPMVVLEQAPDRTYHSSLDVPENLSQGHLARIGRMVAEAARFFADARPKEIEALARRVHRHTLARLRKNDGPKRAALEEARIIWADLLRFMNSEKDRKSLRKKSAAWWQSLVRQAGQDTLPMTCAGEAEAAVLERARATVAQKAFKGYLGFENIRGAKRRRLAEIIGHVGWGPPEWLQWAVDLCDGQRSVLQIHGQMLQEGSQAELPKIIDAFDFLAKEGLLMLRSRALKRRA